MRSKEAFAYSRSTGYFCSVAASTVRVRGSSKRPDPRGGRQRVTSDGGKGPAALALVLNSAAGPFVEFQKNEKVPTPNWGLSVPAVVTHARPT
jgi:hypothetical protein